MQFLRLPITLSLSLMAITTNALEALDDKEMKDVNGQEGITIDRSYSITIDEIVFVDADGAGAPNNTPTINNTSLPNTTPQSTSTAPGYVILKDIKVGNFVDAQGNFHELRPITETGMRIDAVSDGVLITNGNIGE